jgi:hypothetical protein
MARRLKQIHIPTAAERLKKDKEAKTGPFTPPTAPAVLQPAVFDGPLKPSEWLVRYEAIKAAARARLAVQRAEAQPKRQPPVDPKTLTSETIIEGDTVANWDAKATRDMEDCKSKVLDMTDFPGWALWAVYHWQRLGKPTPSTKVLEEVTTLREEAEKLVKFAALDQEKAKSQNDKKAASKKAAEKFDKANKIAKEHKKK